MAVMIHVNGARLFPEGHGSRDPAAYFSACNRNKRSVTIDFSTEGGADLVRKLA